MTWARRSLSRGTWVSLSFNLQYCFKPGFVYRPLPSGFAVSGGLVTTRDHTDVSRPPLKETQQCSVHSDMNANASPKTTAHELTVSEHEGIQRRCEFQFTVKKMQDEIRTEKTGESLTAPTPYNPTGDQNTFDIDKELGPTLNDWEIARYFKRINRKMPGQKLYKAEKEDIALLSAAKWKYFNPTESFVR